VVHSIKIRCYQRSKRVFGCFVPIFILSVITDLCLTIQNQIQLPDQISLSIDKLVVTESFKRSIRQKFLDLSCRNSLKYQRLSQHQGKVIHLFEPYSLNILIVDLVLKSQQNCNFFDLNSIGVSFMSLKHICQQHLSRLIFEYFQILFLLFFNFLLVIGCNATFH